jgi:hypothetical protein
MIRKVLLTVFSIFLAWQAIDIVSKVEMMQIESIPVLLLLSWLINLFITGVFAFLVFAYPIEKTLTETYYSIRNPRRLKQVYNGLKVDYFRIALIATIWRSKKKQKGYFSGRADGIDNLITQSKKSEWGHFMPFIFVNLSVIYFLSIGLVQLAIFTLFINVIGNLYPILLQRHHRMRIQVLRKRKK